MAKMANVVRTSERADVVHGRWVKMTGMMPPEYHGHYECSECQWHMKGLRNSWTREEEMSFCPNCGARMDLDEAGWPVVKGRAPDLVDVVRCRDCRHRGHLSANGKTKEYPDDVCKAQCYDRYYSWIPGDDWFCADGERGEGDGEVS